MKPTDQYVDMAGRIDHLEDLDNDELPKVFDKAFTSGTAVQMRSSLDDLPTSKAIRIYWRVSLICMLCAFGGALEGYQVAIASSIVSNKGFISQMSGGDTKLNPTHVAVWGGMLSTGQLVGVGFLQMATDRLGRKIAMHITWLTLCIAVALESAASNWLYWLFAKLIGGAGLGMMQATYPLYISEQSPTQIRGFLTASYMFWYVAAQIFAPLALRQLAITDPYDFKIAIYTQWGMLGALLLINIFIPESPWWLVQRGKYNSAQKVLASTHKNVPGYDVKNELGIIVATVEHELLVTREIKNQLAQIFQGINAWRLFIAFWPKAMQQLAGQSVTNNYATYFFPLMLKVWSVQTGYFFGAAGAISCVIGYFVLPEITRRTPAEIDEMFQDRIAPRKFRKHVTQVQLFLVDKENMERVPGEEKA
ncbi:putative sugar transporter protein [Eutypa lata UCREL1]|uniref:Putative sugar transporter protein n=1 Tax=Eutypa lata (strain UCR-EL1) TaxID=1287681 RepID=M7TNN6_EUTLA|nr:putative sugar transporter protein [Eutypa lata UCREL1]